MQSNASNEADPAWWLAHCMPWLHPDHPPTPPHSGNSRQPPPSPRQFPATQHDQTSGLLRYRLADPDPQTWQQEKWGWPDLSQALLARLLHQHLVGLHALHLHPCCFRIQGLGFFVFGLRLEA